MKEENIEKILNEIFGLLGKLLIEIMGNRKAVDLVNDAMIALNNIEESLKK